MGETTSAHGGHYNPASANLRLSKVLAANLLVFITLACMGSVWALPIGAVVTRGAATISQDGSTLTITTSSTRLVINYQDFSINAGELVKFLQPGTNAVVLNRVVSSNFSMIMGSLQANGKIILLNPNGILIGPTAQINVHSLIASALDMTDDDFLAGVQRFSGTNSGVVLNLGTITAQPGGHIFLISAGASNLGTLNAPQGQVGIISGTSVLLTDNPDGWIAIQVDVPDGEALNDGAILAQAGKVGLYGLSVKQSGQIDASSAELDPDGNIVLIGTNEVILEGDAVTTTHGGKVLLQCPQGTVTIQSGAQVDVSESADGYSVGQIKVVGARIAQLGLLRADGLDSGGGTVDLHATGQVALGAASTTSASAGENGAGGTVYIIGDDSIVVGTGAVIEAKGGTQSGNGGTVETRAGLSFEIGMWADVSAANGTDGTWVLEAKRIEVVQGAPAVTVSDSSPFATLPDNARIGADIIGNALMWGRVTLKTNDSGALDGSADIVVNGEIDYHGAGQDAAIAFQAHDDVIIAEPVRDNSPGDDALKMELRADVDGNGAGTLTVNAPVDTRGSDMAISAASLTLNEDLNAGAGTIQLLPSVPGTTVHFGDQVSENFAIDEGVHTHLLAGTVIIGSGASSGDVDIRQADLVNSNYALVIYGDAVSVNGSLAMPAGRPLTIHARDAITFSSAFNTLSTENAQIVLDAGTDLSLGRLTTEGGSVDLYFGQAGTGGSASFASIDPGDGTITVTGGAGDDSLTVDFASGDAFSGSTLSFDGAGQTSGDGDALIIRGNGDSIVTYRPDANSTGEGTMTIDERNISFTNVEPVTISQLDSLTFETPGDADIITLADPGAGVLAISGTSDGVDVGSFRFYNVTLFTLDAATNSSGGQDSITVKPDANGLAGIEPGAIDPTNIRILTGTGNDLITVSPLGVPVSVDGGAPGPSSNEGDRLIISADGSSGALNSTGAGTGTVYVHGAAAITYSSIEQIDIQGLSTALSFNANHDPAGNGQDNGTPDAFLIVRNGQDLELSVNNTRVFNGSIAGLSAISINGSSDDDTLTVDLSGGMMDATINFFGGQGNDSLLLAGDPGITGLTEVYQPTGQDGSGNSGSLELSTSTGALTINFSGLEPIVDTVPADSLIVRGTADDNTMTYGQGTSSAMGKVDVDNFVSLEFSNKTALVLEGLNGDDAINIVNANTPTGLSAVFVDGGAQTTSDVLTIDAGGRGLALNANKTANVSGLLLLSFDAVEHVAISNASALSIEGDSTRNSLTLTTTGADSGRLVLDSLPVTTFSKITSFSFSGGTNDDTLIISQLSGSPFGPTGGCRYDGDAGNDSLVGPGTTNTWNITGDNSGNVGGFEFTSVENLTGGSDADNFVFSDGKGVTGTIDGSAGTDTLDYSAYTSAVTVNLESSSATGTGGFAGVESVKGGTSSDALIGKNTPNTWDITGDNAGSVGGFAFTSIENLTGGADADEFLFTDGAAIDGRVTGGAGADMISITGPSSGTLYEISSLLLSASNGRRVTYSHVEKVTVHAGANDDVFIVTPSDQVQFEIYGGPEKARDELRVDALDAGVIDPHTGMVLVNGKAPIGFTGIERLQVLNSGDVVVHGDENANRLKVAADSHDAAVYQLDEKLPVTIENVLSFTFDARNGDDTLEIVNPGGTVFGPGGGIVYDGGEHINGDSLVLTGGGGSGFSETYDVGPGADQGRITTTDGTTTQLISFTGLEPISDNVPVDVLIVNATETDNNISYLPGTNPTRALVKVDGFEVMEFTNKKALVINGLGGNDTVNLNNPASPDGLQSLTINPGSEAGDHVSIQSKPNIPGRLVLNATSVVDHTAPPTDSDTGADNGGQVQDPSGDDTGAEGDQGDDEDPDSGSQLHPGDDQQSSDPGSPGNLDANDTQPGGEAGTGTADQAQGDSEPHTEETDTQTENESDSDADTETSSASEDQNRGTETTGDSSIDDSQAGDETGTDSGEQEQNDTGVDTDDTSEDAGDIDDYGPGTGTLLGGEGREAQSESGDGGGSPGGHSSLDLPSDDSIPDRRKAGLGDEPHRHTRTRLEDPGVEAFRLHRRSRPAKENKHRIHRFNSFTSFSRATRIVSTVREVALDAVSSMVRNMVRPLAQLFGDSAGTELGLPRLEPPITYPRPVPPRASSADGGFMNKRNTADEIPPQAKVELKSRR